MRREAPPVAVEVEGIDLEADGAGIATLNGSRVTIEGVMPGERVEIRPAGVARKEARAELVRILRASPSRVVPRCPHFGPCGGCAWQHIAYDEQLRLKRRAVEWLLRQSLGAGAPAVQPLLTGVDPRSPWAYRDKVHFVFGPARGGRGLEMGHYRRRSRAVIAVEECPVHHEAGNRVAFALKEKLARAGIDGASPERGTGTARHVVVRAAEATGETLATLVVTRKDKALRAPLRALLATPEAPDGLHLNIHPRPGPYLFGRSTELLHGRERVREQVAGVWFLISPTAFFQTNVRAAEVLVRLVLQSGADRGPALDLYAGAGLFGLPLAQQGVEVTAVEENAQAVEDGEASRRFNRIDERACRFIRARAEEAAAGALGRKMPPKPAFVVLDPPREGCPAAVLRWIARGLQPSRVAYVSCDLAALARDLARMMSAGYRVALVQPVDMFPHTAHVETVAILEHAGTHGG